MQTRLAVSQPVISPWLLANASTFDPRVKGSALTEPKGQPVAFASNVSSRQGLALAWQARLDLQASFKAPAAKALPPVPFGGRLSQLRLAPTHFGLKSTYPTASALTQNTQLYNNTTVFPQQELLSLGANYNPKTQEVRFRYLAPNLGLDSKRELAIEIFNHPPHAKTWEKATPSKILELTKELDTQGKPTFLWSGKLENVDAQALPYYRLVVQNKTNPHHPVTEDPFGDPYAQSLPMGLNYPAQVVNPQSYSWKNTRAWQQNSLKLSNYKQAHFKNQPGLPPAVIIEVNLGHWGGYKGATQHLDALAQQVEPYLKTAKVPVVLQVMPLNEIPENYGWGYEGGVWQAPESAYGSPDELKAFIDKAHGLNLNVVLDWVGGHFGPEGNYSDKLAPTKEDLSYDVKQRMIENSEYFGDHLQYQHHQQLTGPLWMNSAAQASLTRWTKDYQFDGFRMDAVHDIKDYNTLQALAEIAHQNNAVIYAEHGSDDLGLVTGKPKLDALLPIGSYIYLLNAFTKNKTPYYGQGFNMQAVEQVLQNGLNQRGQASPLASIFNLDNHDSMNAFGGGLFMRAFASELDMDERTPSYYSRPKAKNKGILHRKADPLLRDYLAYRVRSGPETPVLKSYGAERVRWAYNNALAYNTMAFATLMLYPGPKLLPEAMHAGGRHNPFHFYRPFAAHDGATLNGYKKDNGIDVGHRQRLADSTPYDPDVFESAYAKAVFNGQANPHYGEDQLTTEQAKAASKAYYDPEAEKGIARLRNDFAQLMNENPALLSPQMGQSYVYNAGHRVNGYVGHSKEVVSILRKDEKSGNQVLAFYNFSPEWKTLSLADLKHAGLMNGTNFKVALISRDEQYLGPQTLTQQTQALSQTLKQLNWNEPALQQGLTLPDRSVVVFTVSGK